MTSTDRAARWMQRCGVDESLVGDLIEQRQAGRSTWWVWRQTIVAIASRIASIARHDPVQTAAQVWDHLWVATAVTTVSLSLPYLWMHGLWHYAVVVDMAWYPASFKWLARSSPGAIWPLLVALHPWAWTYTAGWCVMLGSTAWLLVRLRPDRHVLILAVFVLANIAYCLSGLGRMFVDWWHEPANPIWMSNVIDYAVFVFILTPASILTGGRYRQAS